MEKITLKVDKRKEFGRKVKNLREKGIIPANIYGSDFKSTSIQVDAKEFAKVYLKTGETGIVELEVNGEKQTLPVLVHNLQKDPINNIPIHVDFLKVDLKKKVTADVPLLVTGEAPAEKQGLGTLIQHINEVEVEALPADLPENIPVDVAGLTEVDQSIYIKDLVYDKEKINIKNDPEEIVVKIEVQKEEVEVTPPPAPEAVVESQPTEGAEEGKVEEKPEEGEEKSEAPKEK